MKRRKYYYTIDYPNGIAYIIAVSKKAAARQANNAADAAHPYSLGTLKRISKKQYNLAHA